MVVFPNSRFFITWAKLRDLCLPHTRVPERFRRGEMTDIKYHVAYGMLPTFTSDMLHSIPMCPGAPSIIVAL